MVEVEAPPVNIPFGPMMIGTIICSVLPLSTVVLVKVELIVLANSWVISLLRVVGRGLPGFEGAGGGVEGFGVGRGGSSSSLSEAAAYASFMT